MTKSDAGRGRARKFEPWHPIQDPVAIVWFDVPILDHHSRATHVVCGSGVQEIPRSVDGVHRCAGRAAAEQIFPPCRTRYRPFSRWTRLISVHSKTGTGLGTCHRMQLELQGVGAKDSLPWRHRPR